MFTNDCHALLVTISHVGVWKAHFQRGCKVHHVLYLNNFLNDSTFILTFLSYDFN